MCWDFFREAFAQFHAVAAFYAHSVQLRVDEAWGFCFSPFVFSGEKYYRILII